MSCEDFPCCGHEAGCCPDFNEAGEQLNMRCTCGATLPLHNRFSVCDSCLRREAWDDEGQYEPQYDEDHYGEDDGYAYEGMEDQWLDGSYEE